MCVCVCVIYLKAVAVCFSSEEVSLYQVHSYSQGLETSHTADWVDTDGCITQSQADQFGRVDVLRYVDVVSFTS